MAKKKSSAKKKKVANRKRVYAKRAAKKKLVAKKKSSARGRRHARSSRAGVEKKAARRKKSTAKGRQETTFPVRGAGRGLDSTSAGQSGDTQGLSRREDQDSESVTELAEEGQYFEAEAVSGVEDAKDPDQGEVRTREVPEDDVPPEYTDQD